MHQKSPRRLQCRKGTQGNEGIEITVPWCCCTAQVLTDNIKHTQPTTAASRWGAAGQQTASREGISKQGDSKHGSRLALNPHTRLERRNAPRWASLPVSAGWPSRLSRPPLCWAEPCSSLISFHICSYVISGWPFPNLGCFPLGAVGALGTPAWELGCSEGFEGLQQLFNNSGKLSKAGNHFPHNFSLYFASPPHASRRITPRILLAVELFLSRILGQLLTDISYWKWCPKLSRVHFLHTDPLPNKSTNDYH